MKFKGIGTKDNKQIEINITANSRDDAYLQMKNMGYSNISVIESGSIFARHSLSNKELAMVFRQLAAFSEAGENFPTALASVADVITNTSLKEILLDIRRRVERGESIPSAFSQHKCFPNIVINLLKVGDASGEMDKTLDELARYLQQTCNIDSGVSSAMMYPKIVSGVMVLAMLYIVTNVLPQFRSFYDDMHIEMPMITKVMYALSDFMNADWYIVIPGMLALFYFIKNSKKYIPDIHDSLVITLPIIKSIMKNLYMFRFCKTLQILIASNVDIIEALKLTSGAMDNHLYSDVIDKSIPQVKAGEGITSAIRRNDTGNIFDVMTIAFLSTGENTNNIDGLMLKASEFYRRNLETEIDNFGKKIEPLILIVIAVFVLILVSSVYLPIFRMSQITG